MRIRMRHLSEAAKPQGRVLAVSTVLVIVWLVICSTFY